MATRFRLTADATAPDVSPAFQSYTHAMTIRRKLLTSDSSALANQALTPDAADHLVAGDTGFVQFVGEPMVDGTQFNTAHAIKWAVQCLEAHAGNNLNLQIWIGIYTEDGTSLQRTITAKLEEPTELATALTNRFHSTTVGGSTYSCAAGDRLVVEFSVQGTPTAASGVQGHNATLRWGGNGAGGDLAENDTETGTTFNPWIEFESSITFLPKGHPAVKRTAGVEFAKRLGGNLGGPVGVW